MDTKWLIESIRQMGRASSSSSSSARPLFYMHFLRNADNKNDSRQKKIIYTRYIYGVLMYICSRRWLSLYIYIDIHGCTSYLHNTYVFIYTYSIERALYIYWRHVLPSLFQREKRPSNTEKRSCASRYGRQIWLDFVFLSLSISLWQHIMSRIYIYIYISHTRGW